ncbi:MAG TPA: HisA/HisF-related TIM barrel protein [Schlesneria sp.]|jgi:phosphoribosylformimino-5-aminoimidazole carboxamide ribotide isomerase
MQVLPVIDLLGGVVVRGIAGQRSDYRPLQSKLTTSVQPLDVARAIRSTFGFTNVYLADLDAIVDGQPNWNSYQTLLNDGFRLLVDAGVRDVALSLELRRIGVEPIVGLESCPSPSVLAEIVTANHGHVTFSLDLKNGRPLLASDSAGWIDNPTVIARQAVASGVSRMIVLDLADVGTSSGGQTKALCQSLRAEFPHLFLTCGGGVRGIDDLQKCQSWGASCVLVASALHDGRLTVADLRHL